MENTPIYAAIYTRKSSEEGLGQEFNSLDAQQEALRCNIQRCTKCTRVACKAYIQSQKHEGWILVEKEYSDGGISGGAMNRPGLQELLKDIGEGAVNLIVVYKIDRLTRSLSDFSKLVDILDKHGTSFVSITQQFNTSTSTGRLTLNMLLSFAQFEREMAGERVRDNMAAMARKGEVSSLLCKRRSCGQTDNRPTDISWKKRRSSPIPNMMPSAFSNCTQN